MRRHACLIVVALLGWVFSAARASPTLTDTEREPEVTFTLDLTQTHQRIANFGGSSGMRSGYLAQHWPRETVEQMAEWLFSKEFDEEGNPKGIGMSCFRVQIGAGTMYQGERGADSGIRLEWRRTESFLQPDGRYDWDACAGEVWWMKTAHRYGVETLIGYSNSPPIYMTKSGYGYRAKETPVGNLKDDAYDDFARFLATVAGHFEDEGIGFDYIAPVNEPQWAWQYDAGGPAKQEGSQWNNAQIKRIVEELDRALANRRARAKILITEAAHLEALYGWNVREAGRQLSFWDRRSPLYVARSPRVARAVAGHSYFTDKGDEQLVDVRRRVRDGIRKIGDPRLTYWMTEYCLLQDGYKDGKESVTEMGGAMFIAKVIHYDLTEGDAAAWQWWASNNGGEPEGRATRYSLMKANDPSTTVPSKNLWVLGQWSRFVRPGMVRIGVERSDELDAVASGQKQMVSAYLDRRMNNVVVVLINYETRDVAVGVKGGEALLRKRALTPFVTTGDAAMNMIRHGPVAYGQTVVLPARSVVTLVLKPDAPVPGRR